MTPNALDRLVAAERQGLRLAVVCRTVVVAVAFSWWVGAGLILGTPISPWAVAILGGLLTYGVINALLIGTPLDRWWLKYTIYGVDILAICAMFAFVPIRVSAEIPQIIAFRAYGIYYLFPVIALACLSLSWRLVLWSGFIAVIGWGSAFLYVVHGMERTLGWVDFPPNANAADYEEIFLSMDFIGRGNRIVEAGILFMAAAILAFAVYRARRVFFAQIKAEAEREREREKRERIALTLGRYVPEAIAERLIEDEAALAPQERHAAILVMDVADFTRFAADRRPSEVIETLNAFLSRSADTVSRDNGVVIQFTGDGLLATFNTPIELDRPEDAALNAARALHDVARQAGFSIRVGLAAGPVVAGSIGSAERQAFTVYGDTVNRAARLEGLAKSLKAGIVMDQFMAQTVNRRDGITAAGAHTVQGIPDPIRVWVG